jgi:hypothetical protein
VTQKEKNDIALASISEQLDLLVEMMRDLIREVAAGRVGRAAPIDQVYNLKQAAEFLGFSVRKLRDCCREERIIHSRPDRRTYQFRLADLQEFLARNRHQQKSIYR